LKKFLVDIDGTICQNTHGEYHIAEPIQERINFFNELFDEGHEIIYWTARGGNSGKDWSELTQKQLNDWGVKRTDLRMDKPAYDFWIDDKAFNADHFFKEKYFYDI
jgi:hypothetical protein